QPAPRRRERAACPLRGLLVTSSGTSWHSRTGRGRQRLPRPFCVEEPTSPLRLDNGLQIRLALCPPSPVYRRVSVTVRTCPLEDGENGDPPAVLSQSCVASAGPCAVRAGPALLPLPACPPPLARRGGSGRE